MDVEPSLANFCKGGFNNLFEAANPTLLSGVEFNLCDARTLNLFKFFHAKSLSFTGNIVNAVILEQLVALCSYIDHGLNNLFLDEK